MRTALLAFLIITLCSQPSVAADAIETLKARYQQLGITTFSAKAGKRLWQHKHPHQKSGQLRSCRDCHGATLSAPGSHIRTGKRIKPISPAVEPKRFSSTKKIEKWFKRNCKWTIGRPCSPQEKGDILTFIQTESWSN